MSDKREEPDDTDAASTDTPGEANTQENQNAGTDEDTASGGAPADPDPSHF